ncbi:MULTISPECIES: hypothetical protein [unclassified Rhodococcus (in: high G+C Gram-positive bacteria)]|uniref:hypothetical protein n=1 Tax=unclassified Rhodococcus (in: high G+C Gram-positive bacteria) TaxID=192944 RepID=UPI000BD548E3|nr:MULTISPECIES: hypothetical protein [unclassified Rhodococcus (in: high G+C Gram-positive bacteria)]MBP1160552.1 hypothetical protein [Rhodococcus sp. PvR099]PTR36413.1 hypothetical protein C8K38_1247 [Rhodococcus sp. OK611]SNX93900.1 hypothetical protein SAMN05447004_1257 [Rhodococcus sp. OK270]
MNRRFVATLMFVTAGILMAPAAAHAETVICGPGETQTDGGNSCSNGSTQVKPTAADAGNSSSGFDFEAIEDLASLIESFTGGIKSGL